MNETAWPFAVSRNKLLDWRPILAPCFMIDSGSAGLLVYETAEPVDPQAATAVRFMHSDRLGDLTLVYRQTRADTSLLGETGEQVLHDRVGRPITLIEGFVLKGHVQQAVGTWAPALPGLRTTVQPVFRDFWGQTQESKPAVPSSPLARAVGATAAPSAALPGESELSSFGSLLRRWWWAPVVPIAAIIAYVVYRSRI